MNQHGSTTIAAALSRRFGPDAEPGSIEDGLDPFFARTLMRGSCRDFLDRPIGDGLVELLIATSLCAPSKSDLQQVGIVEIASPSQRSAVAALAPGLEWLGSAPRLLVICADAHRYGAIASLHGIGLGNDDLEGFFNAAVDAALVLQTLILAAEAAGLGCCPVSSLRHQAAALSRLLTLPPRTFPIAGLVLGHPLQPPAVKPRLPRCLTVHRDRYTVRDLPAAIRSYDLLRASQARQAGPARSWSEERSIHHDPAKSEMFRAYVAAAGFDLGTPSRTSVDPDSSARTA